VTVGLVTRGLIGGSATDATPPVISNLTPSSGVEPGAPGGFSASYAVAKFTPIEFDLTDTAPGIGTFEVWCQFPDTDDVLLVHDGTNYRGRFAARSTIEAITNGYHLAVLPASGWPPGTIPDFTIRASDSAGNVEGA
jgi:hypothetical protein